MIIYSNESNVVMDLPWKKEWNIAKFTHGHKSQKAEELYKLY